MREKIELLGGEDAAYIALEGIDRESIIWSVGTGDEIEFEKEVIKRAGAEVFGFDPAPEAAEIMAGMDLPRQFRFFNWGLARDPGMREMYMNRGSSFSSATLLKDRGGGVIRGEFKTIFATAEELGHKEIDYIKLHIQGEEYRLLPDFFARNDGRLDIVQWWIKFHPDFRPQGSPATEEIEELFGDNGYICLRKEDDGYLFFRG